MAALICLPDVSRNAIVHPSDFQLYGNPVCVEFKIIGLPIPRCPMLRFVPDILDLIPPLQHRLELPHCFLARWTRSNFSFEGCGFWLDYPIRVGYQGMSLPTPGRVGETHSDLWKANHKN